MDSNDKEIMIEVGRQIGIVVENFDEKIATLAEISSANYENLNQRMGDLKAELKLDIKMVHQAIISVEATLNKKIEHLEGERK